MWQKIKQAPEYEMNTQTGEVRNGRTQRQLKRKGDNAYQLSINGKLQYFKISELQPLTNTEHSGVSSVKRTIVSQPTAPATKTVGIIGSGNLTELYGLIRGLENVGCRPPIELIEKTREVEDHIIETEIIPELNSVIKPILEKIDRNLVFIIDSDLGETVVKLTNKRSFIPPVVEKSSTKQKTENENRNAVVVPVEEVNSSTNFEEPHTRNQYERGPIGHHEKTKNVGVSVKFPDGTIIYGGSRKGGSTMVEAFNKIGIERVYNLNLYSGGYQLISKTPYPDKCQQMVSGDYYVFTHFNNERKAKMLKAISEKLNLGLVIEKVVVLKEEK